MSQPGRTPQDSRLEPGRSSPRVWCLRYATCPHPQTRLRTAPYEWRSAHPSRQTDSIDVPPTTRYVRTPHPPIRGMIIQTAGSQTILSGRVGGGAQTHGGLFVRHVDEMGHGLQAAFVGSRGAHRCLARRHRFQCAVLECKCDCARTLCGCHATHDKAYSRPSGESTQTNAANRLSGFVNRPYRHGVVTNHAPPY